MFWQTCRNWRIQKVPYVRKGFCVHFGRGSNPGPPARQPHALATELPRLPPNIYTLLLLSDPQQAALKGTVLLYRWGLRRRWKIGKTPKSRSEERVVGHSSASLLPARKREAVTQGRTRGLDDLAIFEILLLLYEIILFDF